MAIYGYMALMEKYGHIAMLIFGCMACDMAKMGVYQESNGNLAKLDDGLAESPTVMVVDKTKKKQFLGKIGAYLNPVGLSSRPI